MKVGFHVSITGSIDRAVDRARSIGCDTFQIFTRNPRGWRYKDLVEEEVEGFRRKVKVYGIWPPIAHMPYLPNLASPKPEVYEKSVAALKADLERCRLLGIPYLVTHLGSHLGAGMEVGFRLIVSALQEALSRSRGDTMILLENTAGTKNSMGSSFEAIRVILKGLDWDRRLGICFDTCHAFAAGYDLRSREALLEVMERLDRVLGMDLLKVIHINDSKGDLASHIDRHEHIGMGYIGEEGFRAILGYEALQDLPFILETPVDSRRDDYENIAKVRELASEGRDTS